MTTRELIDEYVATKTNLKTPRKFRSMIDRQDLYSYEEEIGKTLLEMNSDEILFFLKERITNQTGRRPPFSTIYVVANCYRNLIEWYNENYTPIYNPLNDKRFMAHNLSLFLASEQDVFATQDMEDFISGVRRFYDPERADFVELMTRLFYSGFSKSTEILDVKEADVFPKARSIRLKSYRSVELDEKTFNLATLVHSYPSMPGRRATFVMAPYRGSYFGVPTRASEVITLNDKEPTIACAIFHNCIRKAIKDTGFKKDFSYMTLYQLGFYDMMVRTYGAEKTNDILQSSYDADKSDDFKAAARLWGVQESDFTQLKNKLVFFVH